MERVASSIDAIHATGLTTLAEPPSPALDVVLVHGFTGHPVLTWLSRRGQPGVEPPGAETGNGNGAQGFRHRAASAFSRNAASGSGTETECTYWPKDMLPSNLQSARVMTYGYDTKVRHWAGPPASTNDLYDIANDFLVMLEASRREDPSRPLIFIAHSLGGIVVKEMLRQSNTHKNGLVHLHNIVNSTVGMVFFGTPHGGADPRGFLHHVLEKVIKCAGFTVNQKIVDSLLPSSERLKQLRQEFGPLARSGGWIIHSFREEVGVLMLGGKKVVEDASACLGDVQVESTEGIGRDHMGMCRFTLEDPEYKKVAAAVERIAAPILSQTWRRQMADMRRGMIRSLGFHRMDARFMTVGAAEQDTCYWLLDTPEYRDWHDVSKMSEHHGLFWVRGKPGAGKSTLAKFAVAKAQQTLSHGSIIVQHFFNARGTELEKSTSGMYRSILFQLVTAEPKVEPAFDFLIARRWGVRSTHSNAFDDQEHVGYDWTVDQLKSVFEAALRYLDGRELVCFIDALDEADEDSIRDMVGFLERLLEPDANRPPLRAWFSSRHYPHISVRRGLIFNLEHQAGHSEDISRYIRQRLYVGDSPLGRDIHQQIVTKAAGVFMWVVLVVSILNKEFDRGRIHAMRHRLQQLPGNLHELFRDILTRDTHNHKDLVLCIQWVLFASRPLTPTELYFAILAGVEPGLSFEWYWSEINEAVVERFILDCSKGLVEADPGSDTRFIHESVRTFFLKEGGFRVIGLSSDNLEGDGHEQLKQCCAHYAVQDDFPVEQRSKRGTFLRYAVGNVLHHANEAHRRGVQQVEFMQNFSFGQGALSCLFGPRLPVPSLMDLVRNCHAHLIVCKSWTENIFDAPEGSSLSPFQEALIRRDAETVCALLGIEVGRRLNWDGVLTAYRAFCQHAMANQLYPPSSADSIGLGYSRQTILFDVADDPLLLDLLLRFNEFDPNATDSDGVALLQRLELEDRAESRRILLDSGKLHLPARDPEAPTAPDDATQREANDLDNIRYPLRLRPTTAPVEDDDMPPDPVLLPGEMFMGLHVGRSYRPRPTPQYNDVASKRIYPFGGVALPPARYPP